MTARTRAEMPNWFRTLPKAEVIVVPIPSYREASGAGGRYMNAAEDGSRPARFQINLNRTGRSRAGLEKLTYHEAIPGHHIQCAIALERTGAHPITRYFGYNAFNEGWAFYAEFLADEMGLYTNDRARLSMLRSQLLRARYLILDTGLHHMGWSRRQAIDYLAKQTGTGLENIERMTDQFVIWPGQVTFYMTEYLEIRRLRSMAESKLGDEFDVAYFHDLVLSDGAIPLPILSRKIERWVTSR